MLGLARVRDRLLKRLLEGGLQAERDLPGFLRFPGMKDSERMRVVRDKAMELHAAVRKWLDDSAVQQKNDHLKANHPLIDMLFAFAVAKLDESTQAKKLLEEAQKVMEGPIPTSWENKAIETVVSAVVSNFVFKAYKYRVDQVLSGKPHDGSVVRGTDRRTRGTHKPVTDRRCQQPVLPRRIRDRPHLATVENSRAAGARPTPTPKLPAPPIR